MVYFELNLKLFDAELYAHRHENLNKPKEEKIDVYET